MTCVHNKDPNLLTYLTFLKPHAQRDCKISNIEVENQKHLLLCREITKHSNVLIDDQVDVSDIFPGDVEKQSKLTILCETLWTKIRLADN